MELDRGVVQGEFCHDMSNLPPAPDPAKMVTNCVSDSTLQGDPKRHFLSSEWLMTIAAIAAAVAAIMSAVAAFRQEAVTFSSQLFSKEVDVFATWLETNDALIALIRSGYYRQLNSKGGFADLASNQKDLLEIETKILEVGEKATELKLLASLDMSEVSFHLLHAATPLLAIYRAKTDEEYSKLLDAASNGEKLALIASDENQKLSGCVSEQFSKGKPIASSIVAKCMGTRVAK